MKRLTTTNSKVALVSLLLPLGLACATDPAPDAPFSTAKVQSNLRTNMSSHAEDGTQILEDFLEGGLGERVFSRICEVVPNDGDCAPDIDVADAQEVVEDLMQTFFDEANVVAEAEDHVIFSLDPAICDGDADCLEALIRLNVQLVATEPSPGDIDVLLRVDGQDILVLQLYANRIALMADFGEAHEMLVDNADLFDFDPRTLPVLDGRVAIAVTRAGPEHYVAELVITEAIALHYVSGADDVQLTVDAASLLSLDVDGVAETAFASIGIDRITARFPSTGLDGIFDSSISGGTAMIDVGGLTASLDLANLEDRLSITNVSIGDTTTRIELDGTELAAFDLNETFDRSFDVTITGEQERIRVQLDPAVTLGADFGMQILADRGGEVPAWMLDSNNELRFTASQGVPSILIVDERVAIENGTLELISSLLPAPVTIATGECLEGDETADLDQVHPFSAVSGSVCGG